MYVKSKPRRIAAQGPRSNLDRSRASQLALLAAARALFVTEGFAGTSTPDLCEAAGLTRGALYHHFADKRDLFRAVVTQESAEVLAVIEAAAAEAPDAPSALVAGGRAYLDAMAVPGRTRLLLVEAPAVLGVAAVMALDESHAAGALRAGLQAAASREALDRVDAVSRLLAAAFDRAALDIDAGAEPERVREAMGWLLQRAVDGLV